MKSPVLTILALALSGAVSSVSAATKDPSLISAYAGRYAGTLNFAGQAFGPTQGGFNTSKKQESGTLTLSSIVTVSNSSAIITETYVIRKHAYSYTILVSGSGSTQTGGGSGTAHIGKKTITLNGSINLGSVPYGMTATITKSKKNMTVTNVLSGSSGGVISYSLRQKGKSK